MCGSWAVWIGGGLWPHGKTAEAPYSKLGPPAGIGERVVDDAGFPGDVDLCGSLAVWIVSGF